MRAYWRRVAAGFGGALLVGAVVGVTVASADATRPSTSRPVGASLTVQPFERNASGLTYGASGQGARPSDDPDLVLIVATNGRTGYSYRRELDGPEPQSPAEAATAPRTWTVPVYLSDGKTRVGDFVVGSPDDRVEIRQAKS